MEIIIKQNGKTISLDSLNHQYNKFNREVLHGKETGMLLTIIDIALYKWGDLDSHSDEEYLSLLKRLSIKNPQSIPARDAVYCLMAVFALTASDTEDRQDSMRMIKPVVDFLNSLDNTSFCLKF